MKQVTPIVNLVGITQPDLETLNRYLDDVGGSSFAEDAGISEYKGLKETEIPFAHNELLAIFAGKLCYRSWEPGLNPNVTRVRTDEREYVANILKSKHGSVLEHIYTNWTFHNVSRVFTHELVRHRVGTSISQESLRYVRLEDLSAYIPTCIENNPEAKELFIEHFKASEELQKKLAKLYDLDNMSSFHEKKQITSAMRRLAPDGLATSLIWGANLRTLRHVIELRTSRGAEEEIRLVFGRVAEICKIEFPLVFQDMKGELVDGFMEYTFGHFEDKV